MKSVLIKILKFKYELYFFLKYKRRFSSCGKNVYIGKNSIISGIKNISLGNDVSIGQYSTLLSTNAKIIIGNKVMLAPKVSLVTGNHRVDLIGRYMTDIKEDEKLPENDEDIIIEDDVWIGINSVILKGVKIGKGSVISAGSIVTKNVEPYSIYAGVPAKKIKDRFSKNDLQKHLKILEIEGGKK